MDFENELVGIRNIDIFAIRHKLQTKLTFKKTFAFTLPSRQLACLVHCQLKAKQMYFHREIYLYIYINTHVKCLNSLFPLKAQFVICSNQNKSRL